MIKFKFHNETSSCSVRSAQNVFFFDFPISSFPYSYLSYLWSSHTKVRQCSITTFFKKVIKESNLLFTCLCKTSLIICLLQGYLLVSFSTMKTDKFIFVELTNVVLE